MENFCGNCFQEALNDQGLCTVCGFDGAKNKEKYPLALPAGSILNGRYIIGRVLGQGGFGITYTARDHQTGEIVAIKEFFPDSMVTRANQTTVTPFTGERGENFGYGKDTFLLEAKTMAQFIGCPNIVRVYSYFEENGTGYFVMEYVDGQSFQSYLKDNFGRIPWEDAMRVILPVMDALSIVHEKGIIHRDIAPDNICIAKDGTVKLLDFGAARYSLGNVSQSLDVVLRHGFAPREQYKRRGRQGPYTDVYALGATLYYALTAVRPDDALERQDEDNMALPSSLGANVSEAQEDVILKAMAVDPEDRYQSMLEFRSDLLQANARASVDRKRQAEEERIRQEQRRAAEEAQRKKQEQARQEEEQRQKAAQERARQAAEKAEREKQERLRRDAEKAEKLKKQQEERRRQAEAKKAKRQEFWNRNKKKITTGAAAAAAAIILCVGFVQVRQVLRYNSAVKLKESGEYIAAAEAFEAMGDYRDAESAVVACGYLQGKKLMDAGQLEEAKDYFLRTSGYEDAQELLSECDYRIATELLDSGSYEEAYAVYDSLKDYRDSSDLRSECMYRKGCDFYEQGDYASAQEALMVLGEYKDAKTMLNSSRYEIGKAAYEAGSYAEAYDAFNQINDSSLDYSGMVRECVYHLAKNGYEEERFDDAYHWVLELEALGGVPKGMDTSLPKKAKLSYAESLIDTKKENSINQALSLLKEMGSGKDIKSMISKGETQLQQNKYDAAAALLSAKKYTDAVKAFEEIKDFSDAKQQWLAAMYEYVQANKRHFDSSSSASAISQLLGKYSKETFYNYAQTLSKNKYKDSQAYYKELTAWRVELSMNNKTDNDQRTQAVSVSKYDNMCVHVVLSGGPLNGKTTIKCVFTLPSGSKVTHKFPFDWQDGDYSTAWCYYNTPSRAPGGTCTVKVYDGDGNLLGTSSIRVTS